MSTIKPKNEGWLVRSVEGAAMRELSEDEFEKVTTFLSSLPTRTDVSDRSMSWRSADELVRQVHGLHPSWTGRDLDDALRARFDAREDCPVRPAKYPGENSCARLWGHVQRVGCGPKREELRAQLSMKPRPLEPIDLGEDVQTVFLSHALEDHHFACRVRLNLARYGIGSWLAEGDLHERENLLFEGVEGALRRCDALLVLMSSLSITSAWIYSEVETFLRDGKMLVGIADAADAPMCNLLAHWLSAKESPAGQMPAETWLNTDEGIKLASEVLARFVRVATPTRIYKFKKGLELALQSFTMCRVAFYPDLPSGWTGPSSCTGFTGVIRDLTRARPSPS